MAKTVSKAPPSSGTPLRYPANRYGIGKIDGCVSRRPIRDMSPIGIDILRYLFSTKTENANTGTNHVVANQNVVKGPVGRTMYGGEPAAGSWETAFDQRIDGGA